MKLLTTICMPALMLGAAVLVTPAFAQNDTAAPANNAAAASPAQPAQDANSAAAPADSAQPMQAANGQSDTSASANAPSSPSGNTQMAMNTTGNASDLSSIPDNQHKYSRAKKAAQDLSEDQTTKQLNQQEATLSGAASSGNAQ